MLYVTTRNNRDAFTAQRALKENRCADGGMYLPFHMPKFSKEELEGLSEKTFNQCVADILNLLFKTELTSWDIDFSVGRYPVRLKPLGHRILMGESWHNPEGNFDYLVHTLSELLCGEKSVPSDWAQIAVRIAVLFGIYGELQRLGIHTADIALVSGNFSAPISVWHARQWGLPIGNIVCCCNENNTLWDFICHGQLRTDSLSIPTVTPEADISLPEDLERLIYECGGTLEVERYLDAVRRGVSYFPCDATQEKIRKGMYVSVISSRRIKDMIPGIFKTHKYLMSPYTAMAYSGLMDYRTKTGETRYAVVLTEKSPACDAETVASLLGITTDELKRKI